MPLEELPEDIFVDHLLPLLSLAALLSLTCTSKYLSIVCTNPVMWKRKLEQDFNYHPSADLVRIAGFKRIYKGIQRPKIYVWGHLGHGRRGTGAMSKFSDLDAFIHPVRVKIKRRIVSLASGGWSFQALDDLGNIHVWGTLNAVGRQTLLSQDPDPPFSKPGSTASTPVQLELPTQFMAISCGSRHSAALDVKHRVWVFTRWGRPFLLTFTGSLDKTPERHYEIADTKIIQVACGFKSFISFLTEDGRAFVICTTSGDFVVQVAVINVALDRMGDGNPVKAVGGVLKCVPALISAEPLILPALPSNLPDLRPEAEKALGELAPKLIKIAAGHRFIIGLTNHGHVLYIGLNEVESNEGFGLLEGKFSGGERNWVYLPRLSDTEDINNDPAFLDGRNLTKIGKITHISSHRGSVLAYSTGESSLVLVATLHFVEDVTVEARRYISRNPQNKNIVSVVSGQDHYVALASDGEVFSWGFDHRGSLGLGLLGREHSKLAWTTAAARQPTLIQFKRRTFCLSLTAAGWHTGALALDLDDDPESEDEHRLNQSLTNTASTTQPQQAREESRAKKWGKWAAQMFTRSSREADDRE